MMDRRRFLRGATVSLLPLALSGFPLRVFSRTPLLHTIGNRFAGTGRSLVIVQLGGGSDGLNAVIPYGMSAYYNNRPTIGIPANQVLPLSGSVVMGLHPSLAPVHSLFNEGKICIVQGVGYATPNRSHFRSTDIWLTGTASNVIESTGWLGRDLHYNYPDYPQLLTPSPLALQIGGAPSLALKSLNGDMGVTITDPDQFYNLVNGTVSGYTGDPSPKTPAGSELRYLRSITQEAIQYATGIKAAADNATNQVTYPASDIAEQLAIVARLIAGGLECPLYVVSQGGHDTHSNQLTRQANLFDDLSNAIASFQQDIQLLGVANNVLGMTFTEFGRRIAENGSGGSDHGTSSPMIMFGTNVVGGLYGADPDFNSVDAVGDFIYNIDFRQVYATILGTWFGAPAEEIEAVLFNEFTQLPIIQSTETTVPDHRVPVKFGLKQNYPNPFNPATSISFEIPHDAHVSLRVYNSAGEQVKELFNGARTAGAHSIRFNADGLASGVYFYTMQAGGFKETKKMTLVR